MAKIIIKDLPKDQKIGEEEMKKIHGGTLPVPLPYEPKWQSFSRSFRSIQFLTPEND